MGIDSTLTRYWERKIKDAYDRSQWTDQAGQSFCSQELAQIGRDLERLGELGESVAAFARKAGSLLGE